MTTLRKRSCLMLCLLALASCGGDDEVVDQQEEGIIPVAMYSDGTTGYQYTIYPEFFSGDATTVCTITDRKSVV